MNVLLASDGSAAATNAARFLSQLKFDGEFKLTLLTVSMHPELTVHGNIQNPEWEAQEKAFVDEHQSELQELLGGHCDGNLPRLHQFGDAAQVILDASKGIVVDLIVLGATGHSMVSRMLLGSVSDRVATHAKCSVLVVRPPANDRPIAPPPQKVVVAFDGSEPSRESLNELLAVAWGRETQVTVLSVAITESFPFGDGLPIASPSSLQEQTVEMGKAAERVAKSLTDTIPLSVAKLLTGTHAGESIVNFAEENESDLIIIGDSGHGRVHDFFLGSTTKYVLRHAPCSVWISRHHQIASKV